MGNGPHQLVLLQLQVGEFPRQPAVFFGSNDVLSPLPQPVLQPLGGPAALADTHQDIFGQIIGGTGEIRVHRRHIPVAAPGDHPLPQGRRITAQSRAESGSALPFLISSCGGLQLFGSIRGAEGGQHLSRRQQEGAFYILRPPLGAGVEQAQGVDLVIKKVAPDRLLRIRRKYVQNAASQGELAGPLHLVTAGVSGVGETVTQLRHVVPLARGQVYDGSGQHLGRDAPLAQGLGGGENHGRDIHLQLMQGCNALIVPLAAGDGGRAQMHFSSGQMQGLAADKALHVSCKPLALPLVGAQEQQGAAHCLG